MLKVEHLLNSESSLKFNTFHVNLYSLDDESVVITHGVDKYEGITILTYPKLKLVATSMQGGTSAVNDIVKGCVVKMSDIEQRFNQIDWENTGNGEPVIEWRDDTA